jgi:intergrase/recombinase
LESAVFSLESFKQWVYSQSYAIKYQKQILAKIPLIFGKSTKSHTFSIEVILSNINFNIDKINNNDRSVKLTRLVLRYLESKELITEKELTFLKIKLKSKKSSVDNYVPTDDEMKETLSKLPDKMKLMYLMYLVSGMRKVEGNIY